MTVSYKRALVSEIISREGDTTKAVAVVDNEHLSLINYDSFTGPIASGDEVIINTVATDLSLGSGGDCFVVLNLNHPEFINQGAGHIMKLRYTPWQFACLSVEEAESPHNLKMKELKKLEGMPVVVGALHSQLYAVVAAIKAVRPDAHIVYIMTDGAALPIAYSRTVAELKKKSLLAKTITVGQAFGGDIEAVNIYSGLQAAKTVAKADVAVVIMGPGITGTGTALGFTGIEQGQIINAAGSLDGRPVAILRISFADERARHQGISHHTLTSLAIAALVPAVIALPKLKGEKRKKLIKQIASAGLNELHKVREIEAVDVLKRLTGAKSGVTTMGRSIDEDAEFFMAAAAAGVVAAEML